MNRTPEQIQAARDRINAKSTPARKPPEGKTWAEIVQAYATLDAYAVSVGVTMGKNDLWIAATAVVTGDAADDRPGF